MSREERSRRGDLAGRIAWLYFIKGHTQREISDMLGLSRMQVQRSISKSRATGLVRIKIDDPLIGCFEKEDKLKERFSLSDAVVSVTPRDEEGLKKTLGEAAARYLLRKLEKNQVVGVGWGTTLKEITKFLPRRPLAQCHVVSLIGGWTKKADENSYEVAWKLADALSVECYYISAPAVADSARSRSIIASEKSVNRALEMARRSDLAVVGIGNASEDCSLVKAGFLSPGEVRRLRSLGAAGDVCGHFYDKEGVPVNSGYAERVIGVGLDELRKIRTVIGVAGGVGKVDAIHGALKGGYVNVLITDEETAGRLLVSEE
ncbi:MAG: sugar-binding transcriptional regulator [Deltaproteobacteria bacterium]|nr:sugar-binding transcriptional regulator [Deltaproteobacteria bacterium]